MLKIQYIFGAALVLSLGLNAYFAFITLNLSKGMELAESDFREQNEILDKRIAELEETLATTSEALYISEEARERLEDDLEEEEERNDNFEDQIKQITGTVGDLDKLAKIDKELLQKYSKVYFLNENYEPPRLSEIEEDHLYDESGLEYIHAQVRPFLSDMLEEAEDDSSDLWVVSGYRSFDEQTALKSNYSVTYGSGANAFSADQGYSEHQLGTTVDFTTTGLGGGLQGFGNTEAYEWLLDNAHKYGFVLSYPENNTYYVFEPWHWRFVGTELAEDLHDDNAHFYDWDQREINEYLISIFD
jgi:D-alanyl-D-alanine carboxypeptidase